MIPYYFNPPAPCGAGPGCTRSVAYFRYFNPPAPCGAGPVERTLTLLREMISIHPPLAGRDVLHASVSSDLNISIHPPLAGRDASGLRSFSAFCISIHPPLAGRDRALRRNSRLEYISIHPPLAGRDQARGLGVSFTAISIHPPLAGRDYNFSAHQPLQIHFNPPAPCGAGRSRFRRPKSHSHFNPPAPCGAGPVVRVSSALILIFQSTRPLRGGTAILHKKTVQNIAYCTKSAFTLAVLSGFLALMRPFFLPNVHKFRCEPSEESLLAPRSHAYTIRTPSC